MLRCDAVRILFALYSFALAARAVLFAVHPDAAYPDSFYYVDVARALQAGHGFNIDFIWSFVDVGGRIPAQPILPIASNAHCSVPRRWRRRSRSCSLGRWRHR